jgi:hypothetical protein
MSNQSKVDVTEATSDTDEMHNNDLEKQCTSQAVVDIHDKELSSGVAKVEVQ